MIRIGKITITELQLAFYGPGAAIFLRESSLGSVFTMRAATKEEAFAELVREFENLWVAIIEKDGVEYVIAHGPTAVQAAKEANEKGHSQYTLFKVPSFESRFIY